MTAILQQFQATPPLAFVKADNIQGYVSAPAVNYNQGNSGYRPPGVANQIRPPGFAQPNAQNNQNHFSQPQGYNRGNNFNQDTSYQAPIQQNQVVPLSELKKIKKLNEINIKAMQTQINIVKNELRNEMKTLIQASMSNQTNELKNMMASFFQMNTAFTLGSGLLPSNTIANPKGKLKSITTQSGFVLDGPFVPMPPLFINLKEDERVEETLTDPKLVILKKLPKKLGDPGKFLIPCGFSELKCKALADLDLFTTHHLSGNPTFSSHNINPLSGSTTSSSSNHLLEEFADELALVTFLPGNDDLSFDIEFDLREIEYLLNLDPTKEMDFILEDSIDEYDDLDEFESDTDDVYNDPFDSKEDKIKESKLLIDEVDLPRSSDFIPSPEYDSFLFEDFSEVDALPSTDNEDKDFDPPLYELPFHKEVPMSETLLSFSSENEEKVFKPGILTSKGVHTSLLSKLSHRGPKAFKVIKNFESSMEMFSCSYGEDIRILDVP
nr:hypothetical protein [Tanacetum cinerariifolium]